MAQKIYLKIFSFVFFYLVFLITTAGTVWAMGEASISAPDSGSYGERIRIVVTGCYPILRLDCEVILLDGYHKRTMGDYCNNGLGCTYWWTLPAYGPPDADAEIWVTKKDDHKVTYAEKGITLTGKPTVFGPEYCSGPENIFRTAIGCVPTEKGAFAGFFLGYAFGIAGIVAFFLILIAGFQILTSSGNPEKIQGGKQLLTAALVGLFFIIFSVIILKVMQFQIFTDLPGFPIF